MTATLHLTRLLGTRAAARDLVASLGDIEGQTVVLQCRDVLSAGQGFVDEMVRQILVDHGAERLALRAPPGRMLDHVRHSAIVHNVSDLVHILQPDEHLDGEA